VHRFVTLAARLTVATVLVGAGSALPARSAGAVPAPITVAAPWEIVAIANDAQTIDGRPRRGGSLETDQ
jgi:hypothetical protein